MIIYYGTLTQLVDVTNICLDKLTRDGILTIPSGDNLRASYFQDHIPGVLKSVFIQMENEYMTEYSAEIKVVINLSTGKVTQMNRNISIEKLNTIHANKRLLYGSFNDEFPEQLLAVTYLTGNEKVLEIGGNIGRNSIVISSILEDDRNLVVLECDQSIAEKLTENKLLNHMNFHIEPSALSKRTLHQSGWHTTPVDETAESNVKNITYEELMSKYNITFDTLVLDCEGAFYYILLDMPEVLTNINLIIIENDFQDYSQKLFVDNVLIQNNFHRDYAEAGGWGCCYDRFYEVWKK